MKEVTTTDIEIDNFEAQLQEWKERFDKINETIRQIQSGEKKVTNTHKIIAHLSFITITLELAMSGDENAIEVLQIEEAARKKQDKKALSLKNSHE